MKQPHEMSTAELVALIKSEEPTPQTGYGKFVRYRSLKPEISMKEFVKVWNSVTATPLPETPTMQGEPTHILEETFSDHPKKIRILKEDEHSIRWIDEYGTGGTPKQFIKRLEKLS